MLLFAPQTSGWHEPIEAEIEQNNPAKAAKLLRDAIRSGQCDGAADGKLEELFGTIVLLQCMAELQQ